MTTWRLRWQRIRQENPSNTVPTAPLRVCSFAGCAERVPKGRCAAHQRQQRALERRHYAGTPGVNYGRKWRKARERYIAEHPLCVDCITDGKVTPTDVIDHIQPHEGNAALFWDETNWQSLCFAHHSIKTARETKFHQPTQARGASK